MKKEIFKFFALSLFVVVVTACEDGKTTEDKVDDDKITVIENIDTNVTQSNYSEDNMISMVPTPNELFDIITEVNISYDDQVLSSPDNIDNYTNKKVQSLNFGVYTADLAFAASFGNPTESAKYFTVIKDMGDILKINNALDQTVFDKIDKSIQENNNDELFKLSNETYYDAYTYLKENERGPSLALIVLGGWVESLYIMTQLGEYEEGSILMSRIVDQKYTLENLYEFMQEYETVDVDVLEMMATLQSIDEVFLNLDESAVDDFSNSVDEDVNLMNGGADYSISEDQYNALKSAVDELRTKIVESDF
jgi:hypothetical protein